MAKLLIAPRGSKQVLPSLKYQKLVEITCRQLTAPLYKFMEQLQKVRGTDLVKRLHSEFLVVKTTELSVNWVILCH